MNQNSTAASSKVSTTTRSRPSSKTAETGAGLEPGKQETKPRKNEGQNKNTFSNKNISINKEEKDKNTKNITNSTPNLPPSTNNNVMKDEHSKTCE